MGVIQTLNQQEPESLVITTDFTSRDKVASQLPVPSGYRILLALPEASEKSEGGIYKPEQARKIEEVSAVTGFVLKVGPDAYKDESRFPGGPWCKEGDWVVFPAFGGTRIKIHGKEFRIINDDTVQAVVEDPRGIERA